ncbi:iron-sulfur cluster-binding protein [Maridesulfovibrio sp.]|uniref:iron-sulfur cluster-binding protein n=1 Tax=Maridesulfovibrio sp. TaxID=2795000 RepID=UPI002A187AA7|nr:iron-sulfur cluster-binding protein [Maridesulfovibrio sp.]
MNNRIAVLCFKITLFFMALTGAAQMPIFKRYYIADLPGLGWLADFYLTNKLHYIFAAVLLYLSFYLAVGFIARNRGVSRITASGIWRVLLYLAVFITGGLRVLKNLPDITFDPYFVMLFDWTHLGSAILLGIVSMVFFFSGRKSYEAPARNIPAGNSDPAG